MLQVPSAGAANDVLRHVVDAGRLALLLGQVHTHIAEGDQISQCEVQLSTGALDSVHRLDCLKLGLAQGLVNLALVQPGRQSSQPLRISLQPHERAGRCEQCKHQLVHHMVDRLCANALPIMG